MPVMAPPGGEIATYEGVISTLDLQGMFDGDRSNTPSKRVLVIGDLATSASMLIPVVRALKEDFDVDEAYGMPFQQAMEYDDGILEYMAQDAHMLGHGAATLAMKAGRLGGQKSVTMIAGHEPQTLPHFLTAFAGTLRRNEQIAALTDRCRPAGISKWQHHLKGREILYHPRFTVSMLRTVAEMSSMAILGSIRNTRRIPVLAVAMDRDEFEPIVPVREMRRARRHGVREHIVDGPDATHDFLLANPTLALTMADFRSML